MTATLSKVLVDRPDCKWSIYEMDVPLEAEMVATRHVLASSSHIVNKAGIVEVHETAIFMCNEKGYVPRWEPMWVIFELDHAQALRELGYEVVEGGKE